MVAMMDPVPQSPTGDTRAVRQVQCTEQILPSKESSNPADHEDIANQVQDLPKVSNSGEIPRISIWHDLANVNHCKLQTLLTRLR